MFYVLKCGCLVLEYEGPGDSKAYAKLVTCTTGSLVCRLLLTAAAQLNGRRRATLAEVQNYFRVLHETVCEAKKYEDLLALLDLLSKCADTRPRWSAETPETTSPTPACP